ncbi:MAG TPA: hypothetical protein VHF90_01880 [Thermoleophilaceae bacterium]|nr:hypothetical protein [Thermoleophilaceae bacterium]
MSHHAGGDWGLVERVGSKRRGSAPVRGKLRIALDRISEEIAPRADALRRWLWRQLAGRWPNFSQGRRPAPAPSYLGLFEDPPLEDEPEKVGICCSGGGIRSAAFNLGALQALQSKREGRETSELHGAAYLSAVSGGSYMAASFAMVSKTGGPDDSDASLLERVDAFAPGSPEEQYLRNRSSYLAADGFAKLSLLYRMVLGLLFNLAFVGMLLFGTMLLAGLLAYPLLFDEAYFGRCDTGPCDWTFSPVLWAVPLGALGISVVLGLAALLLRGGRDEERRAVEVWSTRWLLIAAGIAVLTLAVPYVVHLMLDDGPIGLRDTGAGAAAGTGGLFAAVVAALSGSLRSPVAAIETAAGQIGRLGKIGRRVRTALMYLGVAVAGPLLVLAVLVLALRVAVEHSWIDSLNVELLLLGCGLLTAFGFLYAVADLTTWSLHPFYKRRLCSAFAIKRVVDSDGDAVAVERDYDRLVPLSETALDRDPARPWPTLLVCAAANISDPGATPPGRGVTSFTFSAHSVGGPLVGAVKTTELEAAFDGMRQRRRDITLPTAVAVSGAAVAPSMGKATNRSLTFLLALANVRLGVWIPNPRWIESTRGSKERRRFARPRPSYLFREIIGRNRLDGRYLFVTDGGHYDNLGLVELLRRGCTEIYCFDASGGAPMGQLGDALALARSEMQIEVDIDPSKLVPDDEAGAAEVDAVRGTITYTTAGGRKRSGTLVYARNVLTADVPWDVRAHHANDPTFPSDSTADQLYTDQKFEAYRALGEGAGRRAMALMEQARREADGLAGWWLGVKERLFV